MAISMVRGMIVLTISRCSHYTPINSYLLTHPFLRTLIQTQAVASKLHGVEVDIKIIKRKGDPIITAAPTPDVGNTFNEINCDGKTRCSAYKQEKRINDNTNSNKNDTKVPHSDNRCEKSELNVCVLSCELLASIYCFEFD